MANQIPVPRSYAEILGDMIDAFLSRYGLRALKIGSPVLSMFESAAQSQLRSSDDIFTLLQAVGLDNAKGAALDRIGADENIPRDTQSPASGPVTITDTSFAKIASKVFQGTPAPIVGSVAVNVTNAAAFPAAGSVYVGRGTTNLEGPLAYTSILPPGVGFGFSGGAFYTLVLAGSTLKFHNQGEAVVVAQGGNRDVNAGTVVQTPQGNVSNAVQYRTLYKATLPDGETAISGVTVVALKPGTTGNVSAGAINGFVNDPFTGAAVTNPAPFTNGLANETDDGYRERIRQARQARARGTALALQTFAVGVTAPDENKRVLSASVVTRQGVPTVLFIDDGTGYEEVSSGVALETLMDQALGGEDFFKVSAAPPVTKAFLLTTLTAPFTLASGQQLGVAVGGVVTVHTFDASQFRAIANASAFEVVASVNSDSSLLWNARTVNQGTQVAVFAKADTNEAVELVPQGNDANLNLGFPTGRVDTTRLYKNDRLLNKDGAIASITSNPVASWGALGPTEDLALAVDGTPLSNLAGGTYTFTGADFVAANTGFVAVGVNTPAAWAAVFNLRIPGVTATVVNGLITLTSNRGHSRLASLALNPGGSLVTKGMFAPTPVPAAGADSDYTLDRNTGELALATALAVNDKLTLGTVNTRAFLQSPALGTVTLGATGHLWFAVDGVAVLVPSGLTASTGVDFSTTGEAWGFRQRLTQHAGTGMFTGVQVGDWVVFWDPGAPAYLLNQTFRVAAVDTVSGTWFEVDTTAAVAPGNPFLFPSAGVSFVRTPVQLEEAVVPAAANYTASSLAPVLDQFLVGAQATVYRTTALRVNTSTFETPGGDLALVAQDANGALLGLTPANATANLAGHLASVQSGHGELGTPDFHQTWVTTASALSTQPQVDWTADAVYLLPDVSALYATLRPLPDGTTLALKRYGTHHGQATPLATLASAGGHLFNLVERALPYETFLHDRAYFAAAYQLASDDLLTVLVDQDVETKRFIVPMWRTLKTVGTTYAGTNTYKDADNGNQSLTVGFGDSVTGGFDFNDFAVFMAARAQTHLQGDATHYSAPPPDLTKTVLWRYYRLGPDGNKAQVRYTLPPAANTPVAVLVDNTPGVNTNVSVQLGSGALRTGYPLVSAQKIGIITSASAGGTSTVTYSVGLPSTQAQRDGAGNVTITVDPTVASALDHGWNNGNVLFVKNNNATYPDGSYTVTGRSPTTIVYNDGGAMAGPTVIAGDVSWAPAEASFAGAGVIVGDFFRLAPGASAPAVYMGSTLRVDTIPGPQTIGGLLDATSVVTTTIGWYNINDAANVQFFANALQTATAVVAAVNALAAAPNSTCPVTGTVIGSGAGVIGKASYAEAPTDAASFFALGDGYNFVRATTVPAPGGDYQLQFKLPITATLATNSDWAHEVVKVVPRTAKNVVDWLNQPTVSGLFSAADVERAEAAHKVQVASLTPGTAGSVQVQGGTANTASAAVLGSGVVTGAQMVATVPATSLPGFLANAWAVVNNAGLLPKAVFTGATVLQSIVANGSNWDVTISATTFFTAVTGGAVHPIVSIERQGAFVALTDTGFGDALSMSAVVEGDWVRVSAPASYTFHGAGGFEAVDAVGGGNVGIFRVVRVVHAPDIGGATVWIENSAAAEQALAEATVQFYTPDSVMPGDTLVVSTPLWDTSPSQPNQGAFTVVGVGGATPFGNTHLVTVAGPLHAFAGPAPALGGSANQVQLIEGRPTRLVKQLLSVAPTAGDGTLADLKFTTNLLATRVSEAAGSVVSLLDKLAFPTAVAQGRDGYQHTVGLIGAVNRVIYGDPTDTASFPGVAAAGADVNIQGPLVKRIQVTLSLRTRTGLSQTDIAAAVKSAVAAVINQTGIGQPIALSDLTKAAGKVGGVLSVVMVNPTATAATDLISVQPNEKPLVLNVDQDVLVVFVGA